MSALALAQFTADLRAAKEVPSGSDVEAYRLAMLRMGRNSGPTMLADWWESGAFGVDTLRALLCGVWLAAEWPEQHLGPRRWVRMFRAAGYICDAGQELLLMPMTIYRGCDIGRVRAMSWTADLERARWFARRTSGYVGRPATVYQARVSARAVLARIAGRNEDEVVVSPWALTGGAIPRVSVDKVPLMST